MAGRAKQVRRRWEGNGLREELTAGGRGGMKPKEGAYDDFKAMKSQGGSDVIRF